MAHADHMDSTKCDPYITNQNMGKTDSFFDNNTLKPDEIAIPCGVRAKTYFSGSFFMQYKTLKTGINANTKDRPSC